MRDGFKVRIVVALLTFTTAAHAASPAPTTDQEIGRRHYERGRDLYGSGLYAEAIKEFEAAHEVHPSPLLDFNVAQCHDQLEHWMEAVSAYERYLSDSPGAEDAAQVRERIALLKHRALEATGRPPVEVARPLPAVIEVQVPRSTRPSKVAPLLVGGAALALAAAGAGLLGSVGADYSSLERSCAPVCDRGAWSGLPAREIAGGVVLGLAGVAVVVDVALWIKNTRRK